MFQEIWNLPNVKSVYISLNETRENSTRELRHSKISPSPIPLPLRVKYLV